ncbi:MAG: SAM domain and HD [Marteilia pararefringens]
MLVPAEKMQIFDPIYDEVIMSSKSAESVICTRHFQRLASLSQLCGLSKIHPSAHHCRYTHSIGVSHLAKRFVIHLLEDCKQMQHLDVRKYSTIAEIAGLCHDIGHGPFSHLFESVMREISPERPFHHESCSIVLIDHMIQENRLEDVFNADCGINRRDIDLIKSMILGEKEEYFQKYPEASRRDEAFLFDIIANNRNGIDVDRVDYLHRDSFFLKAPHRIDYRWLMQSSKLVIASNDSHIAFDIRNIDEIVNFYTLREFMYMNYYKSARCELMSKIIIKIITLGNAEPYIFHPNIKDLRDICDDPLLIIHLTDDRLLQAIEDSKSNRDEIVEAKSELERLTKKDFGKIVAEISVDREFKIIISV